MSTDLEITLLGLLCVFLMVLLAECLRELFIGMR